MPMNAIQFRAVGHDGVRDIPPEHRHLLDGKAVWAVLVDAQVGGAGGDETLFARLRRVRIQRPTDLSKNRKKRGLRKKQGSDPNGTDLR